MADPDPYRAPSQEIMPDDGHQEMPDGCARWFADGLSLVVGAFFGLYGIWLLIQPLFNGQFYSHPKGPSVLILPTLMGLCWAAGGVLGFMKRDVWSVRLQMAGLVLLIVFSVFYDGP